MTLQYDHVKRVTSPSHSCRNILRFVLNGGWMDCPILKYYLFTWAWENTSLEGRKCFWSALQGSFELYVITASDFLCRFKFITQSQKPLRRTAVEHSICPEMYKLFPSMYCIAFVQHEKHFDNKCYYGNKKSNILSAIWRFWLKKNGNHCLNIQMFSHCFNWFEKRRWVAVFSFAQV